MGICLVSALWFCGKILSHYDGWANSLGVRMGLLALLGTLLLVPWLIALFVPNCIKMSTLERALLFWIALVTTADISMIFLHGSV